MHIIIFDDFKIHTLEAYQATCRFLGVNPDFQPDLSVMNASKVFRNEALQGFLFFPPLVLRWLAKALMSRPVRHTLFKRLVRLNTEYKPRAPMDPQLRRRLQEEFLPEVEALSSLLGRDLTHWCHS